MTLQTEIDKILDNHYDDITIKHYWEPKIIHFAKSGTHHFFGHEIGLIDTPIFQRLRYISQLGLAYNVFPTARHTRFEHSLGVTAMIGRMWSALSENGELDFLGSDKRDDLYKIRVAALLHDIGHGPFSHISEIIMRELPDIKKANDELGCKPHEALGYHIVRSNLFGRLFDEIYRHYRVNLDQEEISNYIVGRSNNPEQQFLADLLNGQFDADKLDYIVRDSYFSGLQVSVGIDRLLLTLGVDNVGSQGKDQKRLIVHQKGIQPLQDILMAKTLMTCNIYNHQKLRAIEHTLVPLLRRVISAQVTVYDKTITSPLDLVVIDDSDILNIYQTQDEILKKVCKSLKLRQTMKRALLVSSSTVENVQEPQVKFNFAQFLKYGEKIDSLNSSLRETVGEGCTEFDVAIDLPKLTELSEATHKFIKVFDDYHALCEYVNINLFQSYIINEWKGHIFATETYRKRAQVKGKEFLEDNFHIKFNRMAEKGAKILPNSTEDIQYTLRDFM